MTTNAVKKRIGLGVLSVFSGITFLLGVWIGSNNPLVSILPTPSVADIVEDLDSGTITMGGSIESSEAIAYAKRFVSFGRRNDNREMLGVAVFRDDDQTVILYAHAGKYYAACLLNGFGEDYEKWYFCDTDKLKQHIDLALKKN